MSTARINALIERARARHGDALSLSSLARNFAPFYETQARVRVRLEHGEERTGIIGSTCGPVLVFMLLSRRNSDGSSILLSARDTVIAVKRGRTYHPALERACAKCSAPFLSAPIFVGYKARECYHATKCPACAQGETL